jgi:phosphoserine phosphatase
MPTIYLVRANPFPEKPLQVDDEERAILRRLPPSWDIKLGPAARIGDILSDLRRFKPHIVHFSAHGSPTERLVLIGDDGNPEEVSRATIQQLFAIMQGDIRLVVLNACYSKTQAELIAESIDCVIGISKTLKDTNAIKYSEQFYEALVARRSVQKAHEEANIILTDVASENKPTLLVKKGVDSDTVLISTQTTRSVAVSGRPNALVPAGLAPTTGNKSEGDFSEKKRKAFDQAVALYGVYAERLAVLKIGKPDGSFVLRYEIENLSTVEREVTGLCWRITSSSGLVVAPILDDAVTDSGISWRTEPDRPPSVFEDVLKNVGRLCGRFVFEPPLRPKAPRSFAWTVQVLNGDAMTAWEFENLYSKEQRVHVNKKPLVGKPSEFFAQLIWFPVGELLMGLRLPPSQSSRPQLRYFEVGKARSQGVPVEQVIQNGELRMYPSDKDAWGQTASWERVSEAESLEKDALGLKAEDGLAISHATLGSYYSLDWVLPDPALPPDIDRLRVEAEVIREGLLTHRQARFPGPATPESDKIRRLFETAHQQARDLLQATEPSFATTLMTWDREKRRMTVVECCRNNGRVEDNDWNFWLPFGLGLAGMCFRTATGAFRYQRDLDKRDPERPENYLPVPGVEPHAFVLSFPIDHPEMTEEMGSQRNAQRCRQLVGVFTLSSRFPASHLLEYCRSKLTDEMFGRLRDLRDACQAKVDAIARSLLEIAGGGSQIELSQGAMQSPEQQPAITESGIVLEPGPTWTSPIRKNRFRFKVAAFDYDGTLLRGDKFVFSWELVWQSLGFGKAIQKELKREYGLRAREAKVRSERVAAYRNWCERAVEKYRNRGLTRDQLRLFSHSLRLTKNCREGLRQLREQGVVTALISGGIRAVLEDTFPDYRDYFDFVFMNELLFDGAGVVSGVRATAYDFEGKADALDLVCRRSGATVEETVFVGDRFNDEAVMVKAKTAIAYPATDAATEGVSHEAVNEDDLLLVVSHILVE